MAGEPQSQAPKGKAAAKRKAPKSNGADGKSNGMEQSFAAAIRAAHASPDSDDAWDHVEELSDSLQSPDQVAALYREVLTPKLAPRLRDKLAQRAVNFQEEWFGDNPEAMGQLLRHILEIDPEAQWAFERITVVLTMSEQWNELLDLYDATLAETDDKARRKQLLDDAAHVAKDFADQSDRAVNYLQQLLVLDPSNNQLASSVERLLERQDRWKDLIELWRARIPALQKDDVKATRVRIAQCCLDQLDDPAAALEELRTLLDESPGHEEACTQLERIIGLDQASAEVWRGALGLLRTNYDTAQRPEQLVSVLERAIERSEAGEKIALGREAANRLAILGEDARAMDHYATILIVEATDADARKQLRQLATRSDEHTRHAEALTAAAEGAEAEVQAGLFVDAAKIYRQRLGDNARAIELYAKVLDAPGVESFRAASVAHNLSELLDEAGRTEDRLAVLERLATLERTDAIRRSVLGEAAELAEQLGDTDRALAAWQAVLDQNPHDLAALDAVVALLDQAERWDPLIEALGRRAGAPVRDQQRRADRVWIAALQAKQAESPDAAIETLLGVRKEFGDDAEVIGQLDELMAEAERWPELADVLEQSASSRRTNVSDMLVRVAEICRTQLDQPERALGFYVQAAALDPSGSVAREGLRALLDVEACTATAGEALARAYDTTDDWREVLGILEPRVASATDAATRARLLRQAATLHEKRGDDPAAALRVLAVAFPEDPADLAVERDLSRLGEATSEWTVVADAFRAAIANIRDNPARVAHLRLAEARLQEIAIRNPAAAMEAYEAVVTLDPDREEALQGLVRVASGAGAWDVAARAAIQSTHGRDELEHHVLDQLERSVSDADAWDEFATAFGTALSQSDGLSEKVVATLERQLASWQSEQRNDRSAAIAAAQRGLEHDISDRDTLELLAKLQRPDGGSALVDTLMRLDTVSSNTLDPLREAADIALAQPDGASIKQEVVERLYRKAAGMWMRADQVRGEHAPAETTAWALQRLVDLATESGRGEHAVRLMVEGAQLPFERDISRELRRRAAQTLVEGGQTGRAVELYRAVLDDEPNDIAGIRELAELCKKADRVPELLGLRRQELALTEDKDRQLALRMEIADLVGVLEERGGRVELLMRNLDESPGHPETLTALDRILVHRGRYQELASVLSDQATKLQHVGDSGRAAELWGQIARVAERHLDDVEGAILAYGQVVDLAPTNEACDALARLHLQRGEPAIAATWLQRRLDGADDKERVPILLKLARAQIQAEQKNSAILSLEVAFEEAPRNGEARKLLLNLYRQAQMWEPLARALLRATEHVTDEATILAYAHEAGELFHDKLGRSDEAVPMLEKAHGLAPDDRTIRLLLSEGLREAGRLDEARTLLEGLIADFGRRRSSERAAVHLRLAKVAHAQGDTDGALDQLDSAYKMDASNATVVRALAELARDAEQHKRAEQAYRALLMIVRRAGPEDGVSDIGAAEVLLELSFIARGRGQDDQAEELLESSLEALSQNDAEAPHLQQTLEERGEIELLQRVLKTRLDAVESPKRKAEALGNLADLLQHRLERPDEALHARLQAVESDPGSPVLHDAARALAESQDQVGRYVELVEGALAGARRGSDAQVRCELLLRLGEILEQRGELDRAWDLYGEAEGTGVREVDVWRAAARVAGEREDKDEQLRLLGLLANLGEGEAPTESRVDALYTLAEVQLTSPETLADGIESLTQALEQDPKYGRAGIILARAAAMDEPSEELLALYEQVARSSDDDAMRLDYLERRCANESGTPEHAKEAVALATTLEQDDRAEALMNRAVEIGRDLLDGGERIAWALLGLADRRKQAGDLAGAVKWLGEAADVAEPEPLFTLGHEVADLAAGPDGDLTLAAKLYDRLLERDPRAREAWEPLATIYRKLGNADQLDRLVEETLDGLEEAADRNWLRLQRAAMLFEAGDRADDAVEVLREILMEDPEHVEATDLLADHFERTGGEDELLDLLRNQLMNAQGREDPEGIARASLRLGLRLEGSDPAEARATLDAGLQAAPNDRGLLEAVLERLDSEDASVRAELTERLLGVSEGDRAAELTRELITLYEALEDEDAVTRVLELGFGRSPGDAWLRERLEQSYRDRGDQSGLAQMLMKVAEATEEPAARLAMIREAATIHRDALGNPSAAVQILRQAAEAAPDDLSLSIELATTLASAGEYTEALERLSSSLESLTDDDAQRLELLRARAKVRREVGDDAGAAEDLEEAFGINAEVVSTELQEVLRRQRSLASADGETAEERRITLRLVEILNDAGDRELARDLLEQWTEREPKDLEILHMLRDIDTDDERWEALARTCTRLIEIEEGDEQVHAALRLAYACERAGTPEHAKSGLERLLRVQPDNQDIRRELRQVYEATGAHKDLAYLLIRDAEFADTDEQRAAVLRQAGQLLVSIGDTAAAIPALAQVIELVPGDHEATLILADGYIAAGELGDANKLLDDAIAARKGRRSPELATLQQRKGAVARAKGDLNGQLDWMQQAFAADKNNPQVVAELADLAEEAENWDLAVKALRSISLMEGDCPISKGQSFLRQGRIAFRKGDRKRAVLWARKARQEEPELAEVDDFLAELGE